VFYDLVYPVSDCLVPEPLVGDDRERRGEPHKLRDDVAVEVVRLLLGADPRLPEALVLDEVDRQRVFLLPVVYDKEGVRDRSNPLHEEIAAGLDSGRAEQSIFCDKDRVRLPIGGEE